MTVAREDLALEAAFWAQLPGNFALRPRKAPITSRNFAAMAPFHNYPAGPRDAAITGAMRWRCSCTSARSPYYFSLHASDPADPDGGSRKDTGHTFICGPTGSGKTVFIGFLVAMLAAAGRHPGDLRQGPRPGDPGARAGRRVFAAAETACRRASIRCSCRRRPQHVGVPEGWLRAAGAPTGRRPLTRARGAPISIRRCAARWRSSRARAAPVAADRVPRPDRPRGHARAAGALVRGQPRATTPGCSTTPRTRSSRALAGRPRDRLRCHGVPRPRARPARRSRSICSIWCASSSTAGAWCAGWMSSGGCSPIRRSRVRQGRPEDLAQVEWRHVPGDPERQRRARQPHQPHDHRADADQDLLSQRRRQRRRSTRGGFGLTRARVPADQGAARARLAHVPGQAGAPQRRVPARPEGLRRASWR